MQILVRSLPRKIFKCTECGKYTLRKDKCPYCRGKVKSAHPPRWSPYDRLSKYRIMFKTEIFSERGAKNGEPN
ncbi:MAG: RNA-protein complex protein Nop10 [Candidatus Njordarchaeota archaeon]